MDPLDNPLTSRQIQVGWEISILLYPNRQFRSKDNPDPDPKRRSTTVANTHHDVCITVEEWWLKLLYRN